MNAARVCYQYFSFSFTSVFDYEHRNHALRHHHVRYYRHIFSCPITVSIFFLAKNFINPTYRKCDQRPPLQSLTDIFFNTYGKA